MQWHRKKVIIGGGAQPSTRFIIYNHYITRPSHFYYWGGVPPRPLPPVPTPLAKWVINLLRFNFEQSNNHHHVYLSRLQYLLFLSNFHTTLSFLSLCTSILFQYNDQGFNNFGSCESKLRLFGSGKVYSSFHYWKR